MDSVAGLSRGKRFYLISEDGTLDKDGTFDWIGRESRRVQPPPHPLGPPYHGQTVVRVDVEWGDTRPVSVRIVAETPGWSDVSLHVRKDWSRTTILDSSCSGETLEGVALAQALLSGGFAKILHDAGKDTDVRVSAYASTVTHAQMDFQALIGPLMLYGSPRPWASKEWNPWASKEWNRVTTRFRLQQLEFRCKDGAGPAKWGVLPRFSMTVAKPQTSGFRPAPRR